MTDEQTLALVLKDNEGNYFVLPQELLEQGRVPAEHKAEIEHLIAEQQDVQGHLTIGRTGGYVTADYAIALAKFYYVLGHIGWPAPRLI